jgi:hypothetical protein
MRGLFAAVFAVACVTYLIGSTPGFAQGRGGHGPGAGVARGAGAGIGARFPGGRFRQAPNMQNRIPAPLAAPPQPPVINGPLSPSGLPSMGLGVR